MSYIEQYYINSDHGIFRIYRGVGKNGIWLDTNQGTFFVCGDETHPETQPMLPFYPHETKLMIQDIVERYARITTLACSLSKDRDLCYRLCLTAGTPALELAEEFTALGMLIAHILEPLSDCGDYRRCSERLIRMKRRDIIREAGFPAENWVLKAMKKIPNTDCTREALKTAHAVITNGDELQLKYLRHLKHINGTILKALSAREFLPRIGMNFFDELTRLDDDDDRQRLEYEISDVTELLRHNEDLHRRIPPIRTVEDVYKAHDELIRLCNEWDQYERCKRVRFGKPPLEGIQLETGRGELYGITPLTTGGELWEEGKAMRHCIGGYTERIAGANGRLYAYHLQIPDNEHATMLLYEYGDSWRIDDIRGPGNATVSNTMKQLAQEWLEGRGDEALDALIARKLTSACF